GFQARRQQQAATDREPCVLWSSSGRIAHTFVISTAAAIEIMLRGNADVLVIPGGRATLLQHKLARDARLRETQRQVLKFSS
ncbi:hypothetical protein Q8G48_28845, partial [Klebsiella pneumoniae]|uniref:hypothetical protein n=1 Tax=Klebsiella pneumoniae TaxID=573 RepID=UPI003013AB7B